MSAQALAPPSNISRNPFRSSPSTPNVTGGGGSHQTSSSFSSVSAPAVSPPPSFLAAASPSQGAATTNPTEPQSQLDARDFEGLGLEEPPPYTPNASSTMGEITVEQGPARPFQTAPPRGSAPQNPNWARIQNHVNTGTSSSSPAPTSLNSINGRESLFQQLRNTVAQAVHGQTTGQSGWSSYPGQAQPRPPQPQYAPPSHPPPMSHSDSSSRLGPPPPRHPASSLASPNPSEYSRPLTPPIQRQSSEFARDFYAAGSGEGIISEGGYAPPPAPPPALPQRPMATGTSSQSIPNDGRPTTTPTIGHPLLKDGKLLVYPKNHNCDKCHNVGYKDADPLRPCRRCWHKFGKPYSGPLAYSFNNRASPNSTTADTNANFQLPLPRIPPPAPPPVPPTFSLSPPPAHFAQGGYMSNHHGGFYTPPTGIQPSNTSRPPPGSVVYMAGDPRIGGRLCWRCYGKGNTSFLLLDRITCDVCGGVGRTFD